MKEEEKDNIYVYSEEDGIDDSAPNYSQIDNYVIDEDGGDRLRKEKVGLMSFLLLLKVLFNPAEGWKAVRRCNFSPEILQKECFYPLLALMSLSKFAEMFYSPKIELSEVVVGAVTSFVSFFFGYFCILIILRAVMKKYVADAFDSNFGRSFVILCLSSLCLFFTFTELLPMLWAILIFLPLWTVYIICKGVRFFKFPEQHQILNTGVLCLLIVGMPVLISWGLLSVLPK